MNSQFSELRHRYSREGHDSDSLVTTRTRLEGTKQNKCKKQKTFLIVRVKFLGMSLYFGLYWIY